MNRDISDTDIADINLADPVPIGFDELIWLDPERSFPVRTPGGILDLMGCCAVRRLPDERLLVVEPLLFAQARLCIGRPEMMAQDAPWGSWDDQWEYPSILAAAVAMARWQPDQEKEPNQWTRHQPTGRRRPGGEASKEYVWK